jgi:hypothetical protein
MVGALAILSASTWVYAEGPAQVSAPVVAQTAVPQAVVQRAFDVRADPLPDRIGAISAALLGADYALDPTGEGAGHDPDPPARYDAFDCVTFAEEVLALALAGDPRHAAHVRRQLRYDGGEVDYARRNHFMELQWIPHNVRDGWLDDVTASIGAVTTFTEEVTETTWRGWGRRSLFALADEDLPLGTMRLDVLPVAEALAHIDDIGPGAVLLTVRQPRAGVPIWITHVGLTVPGDAPTVRHATKMGQGAVRDHDLAWYLRHIGESYKNWPAAGVAVLRPREQGPRLSAVRIADRLPR